MKKKTTNSRRNPKKCNVCGETDQSKFNARDKVYKCKKCERKYEREKYKKHRDAIKTKKAFLKKLLKGVRCNAKRRGIEYELTLEQALEILESQNGRCALTGEKLTYQFTDKPSPYNISLDRINNSGGYTKDNIQIVSRVANYARHEMSVPEFIDFCKRVYQYSSRKNDLC